MKLEDFDYDLPEHLIAQVPPTERGASRMMYVNAADGAIHDRMFRDLPSYLLPGDVVVLNDTRVIKARLRGRKATGGKVEVLIERITGEREALAQVSASHTPHSGTLLYLDGNTLVTVMGREGEFFRLRIEAEETIYDVLERIGQLPLPPYIVRDADDVDESRYQTVYARRPGAVAAPTAGLHFDEHTLDRLRMAGVRITYITLHVGAGTFQPVRTTNVSEHVMHSEWFEIRQDTVDLIRDAKARGGRILAVGTTSMRALEGSVAANGQLAAGSRDTNLFIIPGFEFQVVDRLFTNFHVPKSTLLMLVSAFGGIDLMRRAYQRAVAENYRFFSYGDAMLIDRMSFEF